MNDNNNNKKKKMTTVDETLMSRRAQNIRAGGSQKQTTRRKRRPRRRRQNAVVATSSTSNSSTSRARTRKIGLSPPLSLQKMKTLVALAQLILILLSTCNMILSSASADHILIDHHHPTSPRIVNGQDVRPEDVSKVSFFVKPSKNTNKVCGGALIHNDIIVTAAHCVNAFIFDDNTDNVGAVSLYNPTTNDFTTWRQIDWYRIHPNHISQHQNTNAEEPPQGQDLYQPNNDQDRNQASINYDLMIMRLTYPVDTTIIKPIEINTDSDEPSTTDGNGKDSILQAYGVGRTDPNTISTTTTNNNNKQQSTLQVGQFVPITNLECQLRVVTINQDAVDVIQDDVLCADPLDAASVCKGDSGGPVTDLDRNKLMGIVVFGHGCEADQIPDGFGRMSFYASWIQEQICEVSRVPSLDYCTSSPSEPPSPSPRPTSSPSFSPTTDSPSLSPTSRPTSEIPSSTPTTDMPSFSPTTEAPTAKPTSLPSSSPSLEESRIDLTQISNFRDDSTKLSSTFSRERIRTITGPVRNNNSNPSPEEEEDEDGDGDGGRRKRQRRKSTLRGVV